MIKKDIIKLIKNPGLAGVFILRRTGRRMPDRQYLEWIYRLRLHKKLHLDNPRTFTEKLQWLKLYYRKPELTLMVDKVKAKEYVAERIGSKYIIPTYGVWDNPDEIDFDKLPNQFVLKCNHDSADIVICKDKNSLDIHSVREKLRRGLKRNYYKLSREWAYKDVPRKILAEKYMTDESGTELKDYKVFNFNGEPHFIEVDFDRFTEHKRNMYDKDWNRIDMELEFPSDKNKEIARPTSLEEMLDLARKLSKGLPHLRSDFYCINGKLYFGELTLYHGAGFERFRPEEWDRRLGDLLVLPRSYVSKCEL